MILFTGSPIFRGSNALKKAIHYVVGTEPGKNVTIFLDSQATLKVICSESVVYKLLWDA